MNLCYEDKQRVVSRKHSGIIPVCLYIKHACYNVVLKDILLKYYSPWLGWYLLMSVFVKRTSVVTTDALIVDIINLVIGECRHMLQAD